MLGPDGNPNLTNAWLTVEQANAPHAVAKVKVTVQVQSVPPAQIREPIPVPSDEDDAEMSEDQKRLVWSFQKVKKSAK
jgi:hypothetical protein